MVGTYNNLDRGRVFPMGAALLRRWAIVPIPAVDTSVFESLLRKHSNVRQPVVNLLRAAYKLHLDELPIGPAPFMDMARYVSLADHTSTDSGVVTVHERQLLTDAYVLYMGQHLFRLDPDRRESFFSVLGGIFGSDLAREAASF